MSAGRVLCEKGAEYVRARMPMVGLGTYQVRSGPALFAVIDAAFDVGYRLIDTAQVYRNEQHIGDALAKLLPKYGLTRSAFRALNPIQQDVFPGF